MTKRILHCWMGNLEYAEEKYGFLSDEWYEAAVHSSTCMLERGHKGEHVFIPDSEITVKFSEVEE